MRKEGKKRVSLEKEVITALAVLYLLMMGALLAIHYLQPADRQTATSSSSPAHGDSAAQKPQPKQ